MKAEIIVNYDGITPLELQYALQGLRNIEQENTMRIFMTALVNTTEMTTDQVRDISRKIKPPMPYARAMGEASTLLVSRPVHEEHIVKKGQRSVLCSKETPCCDRQGEYNGFGSGPLKFRCPRNCMCHD